MAAVCVEIRKALSVGRGKMVYRYLFGCCFEFLNVSCYDYDVRAFLCKLDC